MIHILDDHLINQIAAGEVIESPHSVVKELVENAIDANSSKIDISITRGGLSSMVISDNGTGILKDSLKLALTRHATSKISVMEDLQALSTLGFRGEALPSIAGVSKMDIVTKHRIEPIGSHMYIEGGKILELSNKATGVGTTMTVSDIFYNIPVRRNFLKNAASEGGKISELVKALALGHPHIAFSYKREGKTIFQTTGKNDMETVFFQVYGNELLPYMLPVEKNFENFQLRGLIGRPETFRGNRNMEYFFLHGRWIQSEVIKTALEDAYKTRLPIGKFPVALFYLDIPLDLVDVNVHPQKLEVRFAASGEIYEKTYQAIFSTLESAHLVQGERPKSNFSPPKVEEREIYVAEIRELEQADISKTSEPFAEFSDIHDLYQQTKEKESLKPPGGLSENDGDHFAYMKDFTPKRETLEDISRRIPIDEKKVFGTSPESLAKTPIEPKKNLWEHYRMVGQVFSTYWIVEALDTLYFIDQHAAHERIMYERLIRNYREKKIESQGLIEPMILKLSDSEKDFVTQHLQQFADFGYEIDAFGEEVFLLRAIPYVFYEPVTPSFFREMMETLMVKTGKTDHLYDLFMEEIAQMSCKEAIKGRTNLQMEEAESLISELITLENPYTCPHGRPTIFKISNYELEKKFLRVMS